MHVFPESAGSENDRSVWMSFGPLDRETMPAVVGPKAVLGGASCLMFTVSEGR